ncbi:IS110 family transposase, partial [Nocardia cyriacigeorgica]
MTIRPGIWVGIDVGKTAHHACAVDETGKMLFSHKFGNDQAAVEALIARAGKAADQVRWAIDLTSPLALLLITVLLAADQAVTYVPGRVVNTMTHGFRGEAK